MTDTKRITALFGGSFDPIHNGHVMLANYIAAYGVVDEVCVMVSPQNPLKADKRITDDRLRLEMAQAALHRMKNVFVSDFEFSLPRPSFTFDTLNALGKAFPDRLFIPLVGSDNWNNITKWYRAEEIIRDNGLIVYPRPGYPIDKEILAGKRELIEKVIFLTDAPVTEISSTYIRERLRRGDDLRGFIPESVAEFIKQHNIYLHRQ